MPKREITVMNRLALVKTATPVVDEATGVPKPGEYSYGEVDVAPFKGFVAGGLVNPQKEVVKTGYKSLENSLELTQNPHMVRTKTPPPTQAIAEN